MIFEKYYFRIWGFSSLTVIVISDEDKITVDAFASGAGYL